MDKIEITPTDTRGSSMFTNKEEFLADQKKTRIDVYSISIRLTKKFSCKTDFLEFMKCLYKDREKLFIGEVSISKRTGTTSCRSGIIDKKTGNMEF